MAMIEPRGANRDSGVFGVRVKPGPRRIAIAPPRRIDRPPVTKEVLAAIVLGEIRHHPGRLHDARIQEDIVQVGEVSNESDVLIVVDIVRVTEATIDDDIHETASAEEF